MKIGEQKQGAVLVIKPEGPVMGEDSARLRSHLENAVSSTLGRIVLDLSAVPLVDSGALEALSDVGHELADGGQALKLAATSKTVREVLELTDLAGLFEHFEDVTNAVRSFL